jgi:hypothetical protein
MKMSLVPPALEVAITRTGRAGQSCASAAENDGNKASAASHAHGREERFMCLAPIIAAAARLR